MTATDKTHALALKLLRTLIAAATASMILLAPATQTAHAAEAEANTVAAMQPDTYASVPEAEEDNAATVLQSANAAPDKATAPTVADATAAAGTGASAGEGENADAEEASSPASASTGADAGADTANDTVIPADTPANKTTSAPDSDRATDTPDEQTDNDAEPTMLTASSGQSESDADISGAAITVSKLTYTGSALIPTVKVVLDGTTLEQGTDYRLMFSASPIIDAGQYTVAATAIKGSGYTGTTAAKGFNVAKTAASITLPKGKTFEKTSIYGKEQSFRIGATTIGDALTYSSNNANVTVSSTGRVTIARNYAGKAKITVTSPATANCKACTQTVNVKIRPHTMKLSKAFRYGERSVMAMWRKQDGVAKYQIQVATDKNFKKDRKAYTASSSKTSRILKKLKRNKRYFLRIRPWDKLSKQYGDWGAVRKVTTRATAKNMLAVMQYWVGWNEVNGKHKEIIDIYNSVAPLPINYTVQYTDSWCDTTVSAASIMAGCTALTGRECGVNRHIDIFKKKGIWKENGRIRPKAGWLIVYSWLASSQPNNSWGTHIGIVEKVDGDKITTIEGNFNDKVCRRTIPVGWGFIRGYAAPEYV